MTNTSEVTQVVAAAIKAAEGCRSSAHRFIGSNGVNYTTEAYDLPDGSHLEAGVISPNLSTERHVWILWNPLGALVERYAPIPRGFWDGRPSDLMADSLRRFQACKAEGGWQAGHAWADRWNGGVKPTQKAIDEQVERGRRNREEAGRLHAATR